MVHEFVCREEIPQSNPGRSFPKPHVPIGVEGKNYTVVALNREISGRHITVIYLVPLNPLSENKPKEFYYFLKMSPKVKEKIALLTDSDNQHNLCVYAAFSYAGLLYFPVLVFPGPPPHEGQPVLGVYFVIDLLKLIDIYEKPIGEIDQMDLDEFQAKSMELVSHNPVSFVANRHYEYFSYSSVYNDFLVVFQPLASGRSNKPYYSTCQLLGSMKTMQIETPRNSWLTLHPCGAVLQFKMSPKNRILFVRIVSYWNNSLESITSSKLIFHPNRPIDSIEGLHQIIFTRLKPIPLDEMTKMALETCRKCSNLEELDNNEDSNAPNVLGIEVLQIMINLAFGIPLMIVAIIHFILFMLQH